MITKVLRFAFAFIVIVVVSLFFVSTPAHAGSLVIDDQAKVLDQGKDQIEAAAKRAPFNVVVITRDHMWTKEALDNLVFYRARSAGKNAVVISVDTKLHYMYVFENNAFLTKTDIDAVLSTLQTPLADGQWITGVVDSINQLADASQANRSHATPGTTLPFTQQNTSPFSSFIKMLISLLLAIFGRF